MQQSGFSLAHDPLGGTHLGRRGVCTMSPHSGAPQGRPSRAWRGLPWRLLGAWLAALTLGAAVGPRAQADAPCHVPSSTYPTIQAAVNDATCATINVAAGTYTEHVTIDRDVTLRGGGQESTIVDGSGSRGSVFTISSGTVTIQGVTIQHGFSAVGGGISNEGTLTVLNSTLADNSAGTFGGGGILNEGTLTVLNSTFSDNSAHDGGGIANFDGTLTVLNSTFSDNSADDGGGIANSGTLTVQNSTLADTNMARTSFTSVGSYRALHAKLKFLWVTRPLQNMRLSSAACGATA
jgi:Pectinesterase